MTYNKTQLKPDTTFERHVYHRDQFAHYFRWSHVIKRLEIGMNVLDFGCGSGNLAEVMYRNKFKAGIYLGLDVRKQTIKLNQEKFKMVDWIKFEEADLCQQDLKVQNHGWDIIACFEVAEHITKKNVPTFLKNIYNQCNDKTIVLISTPCFDEKTGAANNHIIDGEICEMKYDEFKTYLQEAGFKINNHWGTFASQKDYKPHLETYQGLQLIFERLHEYYDSNLLACLIAPLFPAHSRNVMWECQI